MDKFDVDKEGNYFIVTDHTNCRDIAKCYREQDAHLLAAAPELLEALQNVVEFYSYAELGPIADARLAIAKALGETK